jgi:succinyl-CoA synthetase alpha subunit
MITQEEVFHIHQCKLYGTQVVAWVKPESQEKEKLGLPVFDTVREARRQTSATISVIFLEPRLVADAVTEAVEGGIETIICLTGNVPLHDMAKIKYILSKNKKSRLIGPGSCGVITPSQCKAGVMPGYVFAPGNVGVVSSADTLGYEASRQITDAGLGQTTFCGIGDAPIRGTSVVDMLAAFEQDFQTEAVLMILKNGESGVEEIVEWIEKGGRKPILAVIAGHTVPLFDCLSVIENESSSIANMVEMLRQAGVTVIEDIDTIGHAVEQAVLKRRLKELT